MMTYDNGSVAPHSKNVESEPIQVVQPWYLQDRSRHLKSRVRLNAGTHLKGQIFVLLFVGFLIIRIHECLGRIKGDVSLLRRREGISPRYLGTSRADYGEGEASRGASGNITIDEVCDMVLQMEEEMGVWQSSALPNQFQGSNEGYTLYSTNSSPLEMKFLQPLEGPSRSGSTLVTDQMGTAMYIAQTGHIDYSVQSLPDRPLPQTVPLTHQGYVEHPATQQHREENVSSVEAYLSDPSSAHSDNFESSWFPDLVDNVPVVPSDAKICFPRWVIVRQSRRAVPAAASFVALADRITLVLENKELSARDARLVLDLALTLVNRLDMRSFALSPRQSTKGLCFKWGALCYIVATLSRVKNLFPRITAPEQWWGRLTNMLNVSEMQSRSASFRRITEGIIFAIKCKDILGIYHSGGEPRVETLKGVLHTFRRLFHKSPHHILLPPTDSALRTSSALQRSSLVEQNAQEASFEEDEVSSSLLTTHAEQSEQTSPLQGISQAQSASLDYTEQASTSEDYARHARIQAATDAAAEVKLGRRVSWDNPGARLWDPNLLTSTPNIPSAVELSELEWKVVPSLKSVVTPLTNFLPCADSLTCMLQSTALSFHECRVVVNLAQTLAASLDFRSLGSVGNRLAPARLCVKLGASLHIIYALYRVKGLFPSVITSNAWWDILLRKLDLTVAAGALKGKRRTKALLFASNCLSVLEAMKKGDEPNTATVQSLLATYRAFYRA